MVFPSHNASILHQVQTYSVPQKNQLATVSFLPMRWTRQNSWPWSQLSSSVPGASLGGQTLRVRGQAEVKLPSAQPMWKTNYWNYWNKRYYCQTQTLNTMPNTAKKSRQVKTQGIGLNYWLKERFEFSFLTNNWREWVLTLSYKSFQVSKVSLIEISLWWNVCGGNGLRFHLNVYILKSFQTLRSVIYLSKY